MQFVITLASSGRTVHLLVTARNHYQPTGSGFRDTIHGAWVTTAEAGGLAHGLNFEEIQSSAITVSTGQGVLVGDLRVEEVITVAVRSRTGRFRFSNRPEW